MILARVEEIMAARKRVALVELARHLDTDPEALRRMLGLLERKGRARRLPTGSLCGGGCTKCDPASLEIFEWTA